MLPNSGTTHIFIIIISFQECKASFLSVTLIQLHRHVKSLQDPVSLPMMAVGFSSFTTSSSDFMGGCSWANRSFSWVKLSRPCRRGEEDLKQQQRQKPCRSLNEADFILVVDPVGPLQKRHTFELKLDLNSGR